VSAEPATMATIDPRASVEIPVITCPIVQPRWPSLPHRVRMERLVGCLSTPVPKPFD